MERLDINSGRPGTNPPSLKAEHGNAPQVRDWARDAAQTFV